MLFNTKPGTSCESQRRATRRTRLFIVLPYAVWRAQPNTHASSCSHPIRVSHATYTSRPPHLSSLIGPALLSLPRHVRPRPSVPPGAGEPRVLRAAVRAVAGRPRPVGVPHRPRGQRARRVGLPRAHARQRRRLRAARHRPPVGHHLQGPHPAARHGRRRRTREGAIHRGLVGSGGPARGDGAQVQGARACKHRAHPHRTRAALPVLPVLSLAQAQALALPSPALPPPSLALDGGRQTRAVRRIPRRHQQRQGQPRRVR